MNNDWYVPYQGPPQEGKPKKKKQKDFWTDQISTGGGIGGALAGGATGAALGSIVPGVGTIIGGLAGAILGGASGAGAGEYAENRITGEKDRLKNVGQEALLGGIFAPAPIRALRGVGGALKGMASGTAKEGFEKSFVGGAKSSVRNPIERTAQNLLGDAWGIRSGVKVGGKPVTPQRANELQGFVTKTVGVPKTANADMVFERVVNLQKDTGKAISSAIKSASLRPDDIPTLTTNISNRFNKVIGANAPNNPVALDVLNQVSTAKSPTELWDIRKQLDDALVNFNRNPQSVTPGSEQLARAARTEINKVLNKSAPGLADLNKTYSNAFDVSELVANAARSPKGVQLPGMMRSVGGNQAQSLRGVLGRGMSELPGSSKGIAKEVSPGKLVRGGVPGLAGRQVVGGSLFGSPEEQPGSLEDALIQQGGFGDTEQQAEAMPQEMTPYGRENLMYDMQRDPENADKYYEYYQMMQEVYAPPETEKPLSSAAAKDVSNAQTGLDALSIIEQQLASDPGIQQRGGISGAFNPFGLTSGLLGTGEYENARAQARDVIARIRTGAALTNDEARAFDKFLPQPGDSPQTVQQKLGILRNQFQTVASRSGSAPSLEEALMGAQGSY